MRKAILAAALMAGMSGVAMATPAMGMQTQIAPATVEERAKARAQNRPKKRPVLFRRRLTATDQLMLDPPSGRARRRSCARIGLVIIAAQSKNIDQSRWPHSVRA